MRLLTFLFLITATAVAKKRKHDKIRSKTNADMELAKTVDAPPTGYDIPVPFGHIFKDGFEDPDSRIKPPIDIMELNTVYLKDGPYAKELINKRKRKYQRVLKYIPLSPRDAEETVNEEGDKVVAVNVNDSIPSYWNLAAIQRKNLYDPPKRKLGGGKPPKRSALRSNNPDPVRPEYIGKSKFFTQGSFGINPGETGTNTFNFTTCDEFGKNALFHPNDIVNTEWLPFYIWTYSPDFVGVVAVARVHTFTYPTKKLVVKYRNDFGSHINKTLDWGQPKLLLKDGTMETLLIAVDSSGLFDAIPYHEIPPSLTNTNVQIPLSSLRLKIVDPYLAMMYCDHQYASIMAVSGSEPSNTKDAESEAAILHISGSGCPIKRDRQMEKLEARSKMMQEMKKENDKFINLED